MADGFIAGIPEDVYNGVFSNRAENISPAFASSEVVWTHFNHLNEMDNGLVQSGFGPLACSHALFAEAKEAFLVATLAKSEGFKKQALEVANALIKELKHNNTMAPKDLTVPLDIIGWADATWDNVIANANEKVETVSKIKATMESLLSISSKLKKNCKNIPEQVRKEQATKIFESAITSATAVLQLWYEKEYYGAL